MNRRRLRFYVLAGAVPASLANPAIAEERTCARLTLQAEADVDRRFPELLVGVRQAFDSRPDVDACSRIALSLRGSNIAVDVELQDGRAAQRLLDRPEDVVPTLQALLVVPEDTGPAEAVAPPPPPQPTPVLPQSRPAPAMRPERDVVKPLPSTARGDVRIELSAAFGARVGDGLAGGSLGLLSFLDVKRWLVGFQARAEQYEAAAGADSSSGALGLALLAGRRFELEPAAFDIAAGPVLAFRGTSVRTETTGPAGQSETTTDSGIDPRALVMTRWNFDARSLLAAFVGLDGELGLAHDSDGPPGVPMLPSWSLGFSVGTTVGSP